MRKLYIRLTTILLQVSSAHTFTYHLNMPIDIREGENLKPQRENFLSHAASEFQQINQSDQLQLHSALSPELNLRV